MIKKDLNELKIESFKILNLFALYRGATMVLAKAGAR